MDINLVEIWLRRDPIRWFAGALAGVFAGLVMMAVSFALFSALGQEGLYLIKVAALPVLGAGATEYGLHFGALLTGFVVLELLCMFLGVLYAHFTGTNYLPALLGIGLTWGAFSWIFINNLYLHSSRMILAANLSAGAMLVPTFTYGLSLISVAFFDRALRGASRIAGS